MLNKIHRNVKQMIICTILEYLMGYNSIVLIVFNQQRKHKSIKYDQIYNNEELCTIRR